MTQTHLLTSTLLRSSNSAVFCRNPSVEEYWPCSNRSWLKSWHVSLNQFDIFTWFGTYLKDICHNHSRVHITGSLCLWRLLETYWMLTPNSKIGEAWKAQGTSVWATETSSTPKRKSQSPTHIKTKMTMTNVL